MHIQELKFTEEKWIIFVKNSLYEWEREREKDKKRERAHFIFI